MPIVELGIHSGHQDIELDEVRRMWREFDEGGLDFISVWDHMYESPFKDGAHPTYEALNAADGAGPGYDALPRSCRASAWRIVTRHYWRRR